MRDYKQDPKTFKLDLNCPRCGHLVRAIPKTGAVYQISEFADTEAYLVCQCPRDLCDIFFVIYDRLNDRVRRVFPFPATSPDDYHESIPIAIRKDIAEARSCYFVGAYKGVVVLCRRALQNVAEHKGAKGSTLIEQIDDLFNKGLITLSLKNASHEIRHFGNFGAHPREDGLDEVGQEEAQSVMKLTREILVDLYVRPNEVGKLTSKRQGE